MDTSKEVLMSYDRLEELRLSDFHGALRDAVVSFEVNVTLNWTWYKTGNLAPNPFFSQNDTGRRSG